MATATKGSLLDQLRDKRKDAVSEWADMIEAREGERSKFEEREALAEGEPNRPTDAERDAFAEAEAEFKSVSDEREAAIKALDKRIKEQKKVESARADAASEAAERSVWSVTSEPMTYREDNKREVSYFADMAAMYHSTAGQKLDRGAAVERLNRHAQEIDIEMPKRRAERERKAAAQVESAERDFRGSFIQGVDRRGLDASPFEKRVNPNRTDGQGGYFVPPLWLVDQYIKGLRAGRVAAGLARQMDLPQGTDSINIPKLSTLTATGIQGSDNTGLVSQDYTDTVVTANVKTLGGQEDVAVQLLDQTPGHILDDVIITDLTADYNRNVDRQLIYGTGVNSASLNGGQVMGIYPNTNWSGTNLITATQATPAGSSFPQIAGAMASQIAWNRYDLSNLAFVLHPRRWFWYATTLDTTGRPLVEMNTATAFNPGATEAPLTAEGFVGNLSFGPGAYIDANVPSTDNGSGVLSGTNDVAIAAKWDDVWLFEGELRTRVLPEVLSGTLEVRFQVYNYVAALVRYGQSLAIAQGTYFAAPTAGGTLTSVTF